jgi:hypothetical protein
MSILHILCYDSSLVKGTVVSLTTAKFKLLIFNWLTSKPHLAYNLSARIAQKTPFFCCRTIVAFVSVAAVSCLLSCYPEMALVYPPISRSLHSNGSTLYNIILLSTSTPSDLQLKFCLHISHGFYMPRLSHNPYLYYHNNIWWRIIVMEFIIAQCYVRIIC